LKTDAGQHPKRRTLCPKAGRNGKKVKAPKRIVGFFRVPSERILDAPDIPLLCNTKLLVGFSLVADKYLGSRVWISGDEGDSQTGIDNSASAIRIAKVIRGNWCGAVIPSRAQE
jgi:hypothetical protein